MKLDKINIKLKLMVSRISIFREAGEIYSPRPDYEKLFIDFKHLANELKELNPELFNDVTESIHFIIGNKMSFHNTPYTAYEGCQLELLYFEVEKALNYISLSIRDKSVDTIPVNPLSSLNIISDRFHKVVKQLRKRHNNQTTLDVKDEYDVQDLYHALLSLFYEDIRPESYVPEYAGGNSRIDFVLKNEDIAIEIKKSRKSLKSKELGEQLIIDIDRYKVYPNIDSLYCFVYDPDGWIDNPVGIENDLSGVREGLNIIVRIEPK